MIHPFFAPNREVGAFELALLQAADELHRQPRRRARRGERRRRTRRG